MKLALIGLTYPYRGGISHYTTSLYRALDKQHKVLLISFSRQYPNLLFPGKTQDDQSLHPFQAPAEPLLDSINPSSWKRVAERLLAYQPDLVLFQWWQPFFGPAYNRIVRRFRRGSETPVFYLCHNVYPHEQSRVLGRLLIRSAFKQVDGFLVHSKKLASQVRDFNKKGPVRQIFHPVYDFYSQWAPEQVARDSVPRILFFGKIRDYKGLGTLLQAFSFLRREMEFRALIAGEFYVDPKPYQRMAKAFRVSDCVIWDNRYIPNEQVPSLFLQADLLVVPYLDASQSGVIPLAYQFDIPVVASDVGGLAELVLDAETGYLVPPGEAESLGRKMAQYFREGRKSEFQSNIRSFKKNLSWQQAVDGIVALFHTVTRNSKPLT